MKVVPASAPDCLDTVQTGVLGCFSMAKPSFQVPMQREDIPAVLDRLGILPTSQRVEIAAVVLADKQHLSADQVLSRLRDAGAVVSKATVYNTLGLFAEKGLLREVIVDPARVFYDSNTSAHYHFYNLDDRTLEDIDTRAISLDGLPRPPAGTHTEGVDVIVRLRNERR
jgi:Fur family iron response transcriptional regulator